MTIEDFSSAKLRIKRVPKVASLGLKLLEPAVAPIPFKKKTLMSISQNSIKEFALDEKELQAVGGTHLHDHIKQNKLLASKIRHVGNIKAKFKSSVLSKTNEQNL